MVTQKIVTRLSNDVLPPVRMVSGDVGREIQLEICANDDSLAPIDLETYSARITIIKPDKTFVIQDFDKDKVELPEQAGAVTGHGYYQIKIYTAGDHQIYTGQGPFIVDDDVLSEEMIESVAEVNGYEFPDDFLTDADLREYVTKYELEDALAGIIDDDTTDYNSTWSSAKINEALTSVTKTATGNPIEITDGADAPLVKCVTQITGYQSGSGTPSPDNIRPIVAYTEGEIEVRGKNIFNQSLLIQNKSINAQGEVVNTDAFCIFGPYRIGGGDTLDISYTTTGDATSTRIHAYDAQDNWIDQIAMVVSNTVTRKSLSFTTPNNAKYLRVSTRYGFSDFQLEKGTTATAYEPYKGVTHTTTYPSAIYRGSEDVVNGEVTEEYAYINLGSLTWQRLASQTAGIYRFASTDASIKIPDIIGNYKIVDGVCDSFPMVAVNHIVTGEAANGSIAVALNPNIQIRYDEITDVATLTTFLQDKYIAYKLKTPTTSSVTPTNLPIKSLSGFNHIESTTGEMEVEYITQTYNAIMEATKLDNMKEYSTAEQVVGKWIDGRDVYEKTFVIEPASPPMDWAGFYTGNIADLVSITGYTVYNASGQSAFTTFYDPYYGCRFAYNPAIARGQLCYYYSNSDITKIVVTVRYTKGV